MIELGRNFWPVVSTNLTFWSRCDCCCIDPCFVKWPCAHVCMLYLVMTMWLQWMYTVLRCVRDDFYRSQCFYSYFILDEKILFDSLGHSVAWHKWHWHTITFTRIIKFQHQMNHHPRNVKPVWFFLPLRVCRMLYMLTSIAESETTHLHCIQLPLLDMNLCLQYLHFSAFSSLNQSVITGWGQWFWDCALFRYMDNCEQ